MSHAPFMASGKPSQSNNVQKTIVRQGCVLNMWTEKVCVCCTEVARMQKKNIAELDRVTTFCRAKRLHCLTSADKIV